MSVLEVRELTIALPASSDRNYALGTLTANWADSDPKSAMDSAIGLSEG